MAEPTAQELEAKFIHEAVGSEPLVKKIEGGVRPGSKNHAERYLAQNIQGTSEHIVAALLEQHKAYQMQIAAATNRLKDMGMEPNDASALVARLEEVAKRTAVEIDSTAHPGDIPVVHAAKLRLLADPKFGRTAAAGPTDYVEKAHETAGQQGRGRW